MSASTSASSSSLTSSPATRMRSFTRMRCGDVKTCTFSPAASAIARMKAPVDPLPFVPVMWMAGGMRSCGSPKRHQRPADMRRAEGRRGTGRGAEGRKLGVHDGRVCRHSGLPSHGQAPAEPSLTQRRWRCERARPGRARDIRAKRRSLPITSAYEDGSRLLRRGEFLGPRLGARAWRPASACRGRRPASR